MSTQPVIERRFHTGKVEIRSESGKPDVVRGYAAVYGKRSEDFGFGDIHLFEVIERGAFDDVLKDDIRALFNHDANLILARSKAGEGTLKVGVDDTGLWYEFEAPDTQAGRDLMISLKRGDVDQSSFAFTVNRDGQKFEKADGVNVRTIMKVSRLFDVSPVTYPAYPDTTVAVRSLEEFQRSQQKPAPEEKPIITTNRDIWAARLGLKH